MLGLTATVTTGYWYLPLVQRRHVYKKILAPKEIEKKDVFAQEEIQGQEEKKFVIGEFRGLGNGNDKLADVDQPGGRRLASQ